MLQHGNRDSRQRAALTWIAGGITSLLLCPMLTSSLACTRSSEAPRSKTRDDFIGVMLVLVRNGLENTSTGNCES